MVKKGKELKTKKTATLSKYLHFEQETLHDRIAADLEGMIRSVLCSHGLRVN